MKCKLSDVCHLANNKNWSTSETIDTFHNHSVLFDSEPNKIQGHFNKRIKQHMKTSTSHLVLPCLHIFGHFSSYQVWVPRYIVRIVSKISALHFFQ